MLRFSGTVPITSSGKAAFDAWRAVSARLHSKADGNLGPPPQKRWDSYEIDAGGWLVDPADPLTRSYDIDAMLEPRHEPDYFWIRKVGLGASADIYA